MPLSNNCYLSIIIPVCNEEGNIGSLYNGLKKEFMNIEEEYEIIFIDDGSSDNSLSILREIAYLDGRVRVVSFDKNYGKTASLDAGFKYSQGELIFTIDGDFQYGILDLIKIINELRDGHSDAVLGKRINRTTGLIRRLSSNIANRIRNLILREDYQDCSLAGYRRRCLNTLRLYKGFQSFIPALLKIEGYSYKEVDIREYPRLHGKTKYNIKNRAWKNLIALFVVKWMQDNKFNYKIKEMITDGTKKE